MPPERSSHMLLFATALYCEAAPIIEHLHLKKDISSRAFDLFAGEGAALVITGTGCADAAAGASYLLANHPPEENTLFINFGTCGCQDLQIPPGSTFLLNRIRDEATGRVYYPDLLFAAPFHTAGITTLSRVMTSARNSAADHGCSNRLVDQESSALYQATRHYLKQHQILFCKVVSDHGAAERITPDSIAELLKEPARQLLSWLAPIEAALIQPSDPFTPEERTALCTASEALHLTEAMKAEFLRLAAYAALTGKHVSELTAPFLAADFTCKNKKEGKQYLDALKFALSGADNL